MRRLSLRFLLIALNVGLVTGALVAVVTASAIDLRHLANDQALARARLAATGARQALQLAGEDLADTARQALERPGLRTLLASGDRQGLRTWLERARASSGDSGAAVVRGGEILAASPKDLPWDNIAKSMEGTRPTGWFLGPRVGDVPFLIVGTAPVEQPEPVPAGPRQPLPQSQPQPQAAAPVPAPAETAKPPETIMVFTRLADRTFERALTAREASEAVLLGWAEISQEASDRSVLRQRALEAGHPIAARLDDFGVFLALEPVATRGGAPEALIETTLPISEIDAAAKGLFRSVLAVGLIAGGAAGLLAAAVARRLIRPIQDLTRASVRIGKGDLTTPVPRPAGATEVGELAGAMEEMRGRLL